MSVLFLMPNWQTPSEVFLQRMLKELGGDLGCVVASNTHGEKFWQQKIPAVSLSVQETLPRRFLQKMGLLSAQIDAQAVLKAACERRQTSRILCHYAEYACKFMQVWDETDVPLYVHLHGYDATLDLRKHETPDVPFYDNSYIGKLQHLAQRATLIANSAFTKDLMIRAGLPDEKIVVKHLGVPRSDAAKKHHSTSGLTILHLGRLVDFKSPDRTIAAFDYAISRGLDASLVLAGDGPLRLACELVRARSPYRDRIQILGAVDSETAQRLLENADIFTQHNVKGELSRQEECFGVSIVEAMGRGLPVVCTRSGAVPETVVNNETGLLIDPGDVEGQGEAFLNLAKDVRLRQEMGEAGRNRVAKWFSLEREQRGLRTILQLER